MKEVRGIRHIVLEHLPIKKRLKLLDEAFREIDVIENFRGYIKVESQESGLSSIEEESRTAITLPPESACLLHEEKETGMQFIWCGSPEYIEKVKSQLKIKEKVPPALLPIV